MIVPSSVSSKCQTPFDFIRRIALVIGSVSSIVTIDLLMHGLTVVVLGSRPRATAFRLRSVSVMMPIVAQAVTDQKGPNFPLLEQSPGLFDRRISMDAADVVRHVVRHLRGRSIRSSARS